MSTAIQNLAVRVFSRLSLASCLAIAVTGAVLCAATPAAADVLDDVTVPIVTTVFPGQPINLIFAEPLDFLHHKDLLFQGVAHTPAGTMGVLDVQFDWLDPAGGIALSPVFPVDVIVDTQFSIPFQIDFCPAEISLHLVNQGSDTAGVPIEIDGKFIYTCVPEPSSLVLVACGFMALAAYCWRKKR
ncbi:MAG TPA: hypothetical protein VFW87_14535 [Pirellulales bacterium]|nr:hypothetical protein [Pirellulales bacterium]